jgi:polyhydroxybutyrate depolymerase
MRASVLGVVVALGFAACSGSDTDSADTTPASTPSTEAETTAAETTTPDTTVAETTPATDPPESSPFTSEPDGVTTTIVESSATNDELTSDRPYDVFVPTGYDAATPTPLVLLLHGRGVDGDIQEAYFKFEPLAESRGFLYVHPDGTVDADGAQYWNATDACCSSGSDVPDDAAYLIAIIEQVSAEHNVDPKAIFLAGHSNGGFMSYRMACQHADTIAGIASLAGATFADTADCTPSEPVSVLQVHGTGDESIVYGGGSIDGVDYPGALQTVESWVAYNGCDTTPTITVDALDLDGGIDGAESDVEAFARCEQGSEVELWTIDGGSHIPGVTADFSEGVVDFLLAHPKS